MPYDDDYIPYTQTHRLRFPRNFVPPIGITTGEFLQQLIAPHIRSPRFVVRMAYSRSMAQLVRNRGLNHVSYQRQNFFVRDFQNAQTQYLLEHMINNFMNSNDDFEWENLVIYIVNGDPDALRGAGGGDSQDDDNDLSVAADKVFKIPRNAQNLCGFIAIVCHLKRYEELLKPDNDLLYTHVVNSQSKAKTFKDWRRAVKSGAKLVNTAKALKQLLEQDQPVQNQMFTLLRHGDAFVERYPKFRIVIVDKNCKVIGDMCGNQFYETHVETESKMDEYCIALLLDNGHFDLVINLSTFWRKRYNRDRHMHYCNVCLKPYSNSSQVAEVANEHKCVIIRCPDCKKPFVDQHELDEHVNAKHVIQCSKCEKSFKGTQCFEYHARRCANGSQRIRCDKCHHFYLDIENHVCNAPDKKKCKFCDKQVPDYDTHSAVCHPYIQKLKMPDESLSADRIWAFDIECTTENRNGKDVHIPNLIVARKLTEDTLYKFDTVDEFMEFLTLFEETVIFFAHNFGGYDGRVLFKYFVRHPQLRMEAAIPNGSKFMAYTFTNGVSSIDDRGNEKKVLIKFRDSYRHMSQSLRSLPKTYGLDEELFAKGFYPHTFNKPENRFYKGPLPAKEYFHPEEMKDDEKHEFENWYQLQLENQEEYRLQTGRDDYYDHYEEFVKYCESDVNVLAEALLVYMKEYMDQCNGLNPLEKITIASHCMNHYLTNHMQEETIARLKPFEFTFAKEAFFGGRTHPCSLLVENERIGYVDVNSLYPAVMVNCPLPTGPLKFKTVNKKLTVEELKQMHGIFEVDIRPTKYLHHPIFPVRDPETHANSYPLEPLYKVKRTSIEIHKALDNGYVVDYVYSVLLTDVSYDLFKSYIYEAQTAKLLASGVPKEFETEEGKQKFIQEYMQEMGVDLTDKVFEKNPGKRATAKLTNNSLWGKFGENSTKVKMNTYDLMVDGAVNEKQVSNYHSMMNEIFDGKQLFCQNFTYTIDDYQVCYLFTKEVNDGYNQETGDRTNVMLCAFVTANARMVLWDALNKLGDRVLYCDTDSVIYLLHDDPEMNIKSSSKLGEWKDECEGEYITDFVSIAPKSYAYKMSNGEEVVKCKGVTLNYENSKVVTFEAMKALVVGEVDKLKTRHLVFDCSKANEFEINTLYREKATCLNKNMLKGELLMKDNEWNLNIPRDYMLFPFGFQEFMH